LKSRFGASPGAFLNHRDDGGTIFLDHAHQYQLHTSEGKELYGLMQRYLSTAQDLYKKKQGSLKIFSPPMART
jgi:hypothetical protein